MKVFPKIVRQGGRLLAIAGVLSLAPIAFNDAGALSLTNACADGTCCFEVLSVCNIGGGDIDNRFKKACDGPCSEACPPQ